jgi:hypothetical protein
MRQIFVPLLNSLILIRMRTTDRFGHLPANIAWQGVVQRLGGGSSRMSKALCNAVSAYRKLRNHRQHADCCPGRHEWTDQSGLLPAFSIRPGRKLYQLEFPLLQFRTEHGQMLGVAIACGQFLAVFHTVHLLSISCRKLVIFGGTD